MDVTWQKALDAYWYDNKGRAATLAFQDWFRENAGKSLEPWFEVAHWKSPRSADKTIAQIRQSGVSPRRLEMLCRNYIEHPCLRTFREFRHNIAKTGALATAATYPAFIRPDIFPMVDTQTAEWALENKWTRIRNVPDVRGNGKVLYERHWKYVSDWIEWCREAAGYLGNEWTPRDVEMAVFTAQRKKWQLLPLRK